MTLFEAMGHKNRALTADQIIEQLNMFKKGWQCPDCYGSSIDRFESRFDGPSKDRFECRECGCTWHR
jgi:transposase-like protein